MPWKRQIETAHKALEKSPISPRGNLTAILEDLSSTHTVLSEKVDTLFGSLRIPETYPSLDGVNLSLSRLFCRARDLKSNIRKRANESFFEYDRLDQAVGGKANPLGKFSKITINTREADRQQEQSCINTHRKAISKRAPALLRTIRKYNSCCETLERYTTPNQTYHFPRLCLRNLDDLRQNPSLLEDVCVVPSHDKPQAWLVDEEVRHGIQGNAEDSPMPRRKTKAHHRGK